MMPTSAEIDMLGRLLLAMILGGVIGIERKHWKKPVGGRTFMLISLGSCLFSLVSVAAAQALSADGHGADPLRIASNVLTGIGFIGAGLILHTQQHVEGVTSAAAIWVSAAVGMAVAFHLYTLAIATTIIMITGLNIPWIVMKLTGREVRRPESNDNSPAAE
jgi:putative Mg2+ transporter-C (MgtC) family protein